MTDEASPSSESSSPKGASSEEILAYRDTFYKALEAFFDQNPASPKLMAGLLSEACGYTIAAAPEGKRETFTRFAHDTLDTAIAQRLEGAAKANQTNDQTH